MGALSELPEGAQRKRSEAEGSERPQGTERSEAATAGVPDVGEILHRLRKRRGLTLRQVGELSGLSVSFLSAVERGESDISLGRLARVARLFGHDVGSFLGYSARQAAPQFIGGANRLSVDRGPGVSYHVVRVPGTTFEFISVSFAPRARFADTITHEGLDVLFVLVGTVVLVYNGAEYPLAPDDCVVYSGAYPHTVRNDGDDPAQIVFIVTEPVY